MSSSEPLEAMIENKSALCQAYMPFIDGGGVFVPTERRFRTLATTSPCAG